MISTTDDTARAPITHGPRPRLASEASSTILAGWRPLAADLGLELVPADGSDAPEAWRLLASSGYLEETTASLRAWHEVVYRRHWQAVAADEGADRLLLLRHAGRAIGTIAASRVFPGTWMLHHLGIDEEARHSSRPLKTAASDALFTGMLTWLQQGTDVQTLVVTCAANKPFNDFVYRQFMAQQQGRNTALLRDFTIYKADPGQVASGRPIGTRVVRATPAMVTMVAEHLTRTLAETEVRAFAFTPQRLDLADRRGGAGDAPRQREIFCALEGGVPVAAMIADIGDPGVNLFHLLNTCRFVQLDRACAATETLRVDLLQAAAKHYQRQGAREMLLLEPPAVGEMARVRDEALAAAGFRTPIAGMCSIVDASVLPDWIAFLRAGFAQRLDAALPARRSA